MIEPSNESTTTPNGAIDVSILMPCLNEELTLPTCIANAKEAVRMLGERGFTAEILISDNGSTDASVSIAEAAGCRVVHCPHRGYGSALIWGCESALGRFIIMGDSDASYDFTEGVPMIDRLAAGDELCMGSRFKGKIMPGAMPWKNRYIGNPALTGMLNLFYRSGLTDAHAGLRSLTKDAFHKMKLESRGMEFASEMVVKSALLHLKRSEVPITLHKDGRDRAPHLRPWRDGWRHVKFLLTLCPLWIYFLPAFCLMTVSVALFAMLLSPPPGEVFKLGNIWIGEHWLPLAVGFFSVGFEGLLMGTAANKYTKSQGFRQRSMIDGAIDRFAKVDILMATGAILGIAGLSLMLFVFLTWSKQHFGELHMTRHVAVATTLIVAAFQTLFGAFLISMLGVDE